jgi:predicted outer membrane repeat protein
MTVTQSIVENNQASASFSGGGIGNGGNLWLQDSLVQGNRAGGGAGLYNAGTAVVQNSMVLSNTAVNEGGGIRHDGGTLTIHNSTISYNTAEDDTFTGSGGGLFLFTFITSSVTIENSTISHNSVTGSGGGIYFTHDFTSASELAINHSTLVYNTADSDADSGDGGGLWHSGGLVMLQNTIVAANEDNSDGAPNCWGEISSADYNLIGDDTGCTFDAQTNDWVGSSNSVIDPLLSTLTDNGGPTWTHALLPGSPALQAIPTGENGCGTTYTQDQRGVARPQWFGCDIGAFELEVEVHFLFLPFVSRYVD